MILHHVASRIRDIPSGRRDLTAWDMDEPPRVPNTSVPMIADLYVWCSLRSWWMYSRFMTCVRWKNVISQFSTTSQRKRSWSDKKLNQTRSLAEIVRVGGHYAVQSHSRSLILLPIESPCATFWIFYLWIMLNDILFRTVFESSRSIDHIIAFDTRVPLFIFNALCTRSP